MISRIIPVIVVDQPNFVGSLEKSLPIVRTAGRCDVRKAAQSLKFYVPLSAELGQEFHVIFKLALT